MSDDKMTTGMTPGATIPSASGPDTVDAGAIERALGLAAGSPEGARWWRDSRRRRVLALADCCSAGFAVALVLPAERAIWALAFLPVWILVAKVAGLYDADH